jgi:hypothetical protein
VGCVIRLRKLGSNTYRTYHVDDAAYPIQTADERVRRDSIITHLNELIHQAKATKTFCQIAIRLSSRRQLRFLPMQYKMLTIEWEDTISAA